MKNKQFRVRGAGHEATFKTRRQAVGMAKAVSGKRHGLVHVERSDRKESILYQGGTLLTYRFETR